VTQVNPVTLPAGPQRIRVQYRDDGVSVDQIYLSKDSQAPGGVTNDVSRYQCTGTPAAAPPPPPPADPSVTNTALPLFRVATWDVNGARDSSGVDAFDRQLDQLAATGAQVIALQHVTRGATDMVAGYESGLEARTGRQWTGLFQSTADGADPASDEGVLLLTWLPLDNITLARIGEAASPERQAVAVRVQVTINAQPVNIIAVELDSTDSANRSVQLAALRSWVDTFSMRRVIVGAFGAEPGDAVWSSWRNAFRDAWNDLVYVKTADKGFTVDQAAATGAPGRPDYHWQAFVTPIETGVFKSRLSPHHLVLVDYKVQ
jgi:endonuclease/exonuclease/phosphatase family metal-dependent hydrolase